MKLQERIADIVYERLTGEDGIIEKIYGYIPDMDIDYGTKNEIIITNENTEEEQKIIWKREIEKGEDYISIDLPDKLFQYPIRNYKCLDLHSLKKNAKETKTRTVLSFLLELGLMKEELNDAKMICNFDLNKDPKKLTEKELAQFHLIKTRRDF